MGLKLWVTGAASFVGTELRRQCAARGIELAGIDVAASTEAGITEADIRDPELAARIPEGVDAVVHLAAIARDADCRRDPVRCFEVNVAGTLNVFRAARQRGVSQLIFASSEWVYDRLDPALPRREDEPIDPMALTSEYALSKLMGEAVLKQAQLREDMAVTVLRFGILYGPRHGNWSAVEALLSRVAGGDRVEVGSRRTARGFVHVSDAARAILAAVGRKGFETYNIQPDRPVTLAEVVERAAAILERPSRLIETDPANPSIRNIAGTAARVGLGWHPEISLDAGLRDVAGFLGYLPMKRVTGEPELSA